jgi:hypothetical protein
MQITAMTTMDAAASEKQRVAKLADGAHQFEAMLMQQMMKGLKFGSAPGDGEEEGEGNALQSYGTEMLAKSMAADYPAGDRGGPKQGNGEGS